MINEYGVHGMVEYTVLSLMVANLYFFV